MTTHSQQIEPMNAEPNPCSDVVQEEIQAIDPALKDLLHGKYEIQKCIGKGAQGNVYRGRRLADNKLVAIKQLRITSAKDWKQYELFEREAEVLKNLQVQGTAKFYEAIKSLDGANPTSVIVQEYIDGRSLQNYIDNKTYFGFDVTCHILNQILKILQSLHQQTPSVIHRDVKPSNIILRYDNGKYARIPEVFLIDFGAVANPQVQDGGSTVTGTYGYMAPEQLIGQPTPASDIYSFGVLAVYLLSGVPPEKIEVKDLQLLIEPHLEHLPFIVTTFLRQLIEPSPIKRLMDYDFIQSAFLSFGRCDFNVSLASVSDKIKNTVPEKTVELIGQKGNVAQWQALSDQTPRGLPKAYKKIISKDAKALKSLSRKDINISYFDFLTNSFSIEECETGGLAWYIYGIVILFMVSPIIHIIISIINGIADLGFNDIGRGVLTALIVGIIVTTYFFSKKMIAREEVRHRLEYIFKYGRKSLATISEIQTMMPGMAKAWWDEEAGKNSVYSGTAVSYINEFAGKSAQVRPLWKIEYYFNPPDDDSLEPVHHVYYSEVPPINLQIGEMLPILYIVKAGQVYSIPYPLPVTDSLLQCPNYVSLFNMNVILSTKVNEYGECLSCREQSAGVEF